MEGAMWPDLFQKPPAGAVLSALYSHEAECEVPVDRINIQVEESGQVAYRMHPSDGSDYIGGVIDVAEFRPESN